ncbi:MAG: BlaI/MecI/CopY family transcriptional regulator [Conexibacter sp.]
MTPGSDNNRDLGPLEREVMALVWRRRRPLSVREAVEALNRRRPDPLAYTTVMTVMSRLAEKGALVRAKVGRGYRYEAAAPDAAGLAVQSVLRAHGDAAVAHFVKEAQADPDLLDALRRLLAHTDG